MAVLPLELLMYTWQCRCNNSSAGPGLWGLPSRLIIYTPELHGERIWVQSDKEASQAGKEGQAKGRGQQKKKKKKKQRRKAKQQKCIKNHTKEN